MQKNTYIFQKKANGDSRTVTDIGAEYDQLMIDMQPKQNPMDIVMENIAPQLGVAVRERADGTKQTGTFKADGSIIWGAWS